MGKQKADVTLCLLVGRDYATHIHSFEALGVEKRLIEDELVLSDYEKEYGYFVDNIQVNIIVALMNGCDSRIADYFSRITDDILVFKEGVSEGTAYNEMFRRVDTEWVCIIQPNVFVKRFWLSDLIFYGKIIPRSGAIGFSENLNDSKFLPMLSTEDEIVINVFIPDSNTLDTRGIWLFNKQNLYFVGAFSEEKELLGMEITHWQLRALAIGLTNYYIPTHSCLIVSSPMPVREGDAMEKSLKEMKKARNYYLPL